MMCSMPSARAPSVPGKMRMWRSACDEVLRIGPRRSHEPGEPGVLSTADRTLETARPQPVKKRMRGAERGQRAHASEIRVGQDGRGAVGGDDGSPASSDLVDSLVPRDAGEATLTLGAGAAQGMEQPVRAVDALEIAVDLDAEMPAGDGVSRIRCDVDGAAVPDRDEHRAGVGAVVRARDACDA